MLRVFLTLNAMVMGKNHIVISPFGRQGCMPQLPKPISGSGSLVRPICFCHPNPVRFTRRLQCCPSGCKPGCSHHRRAEKCDHRIARRCRCCRRDLCTPACGRGYSPSSRHCTSRKWRCSTSARSSQWRGVRRGGEQEKCGEGLDGWFSSALRSASTAASDV